MNGHSKVLRGLWRYFPSYGRYYFLFSFNVFPLSTTIDTLRGAVKANNGDFEKYLKDYKRAFKGFEGSLEGFSKLYSLLVLVFFLRFSTFSEHRHRGWFGQRS